MSAVLLKTEIEEAYRAPVSVVYYRQPASDRMKGVIVETYKKRHVHRVSSSCELLSKEEMCCNLATD